MNELEILKAACCVAGLDQEVTDEERDLLRLLATRAGVGEVSLDAMIEDARRNPDRFEECLQFSTSDIDHTIEILFNIAIADGVLDANERIVLNHFARRLGMTEDRFSQIRRAAQKALARGGK